MWRLTLGRLCRRSMMKSWPFGFSPMARSIVADSRSSSAEARNGLRKSEASSCPRQVCSVPVQVILTRAEDFAAFNATYREFFPTDPPARVSMVAGLTIDARVEIDVVAGLPEN